MVKVRSVGSETTNILNKIRFKLFLWEFFYYMNFYFFELRFTPKELPSGSRAFNLSGLGLYELSGSSETLPFTCFMLLLLAQTRKARFVVSGSKHKLKNSILYNSYISHYFCTTFVFEQASTLHFWTFSVNFTLNCLQITEILQQHSCIRSVLLPLLNPKSDDFLKFQTTL